jgi:hypothetical protein
MRSPFQGYTPLLRAVQPRALGWRLACGCLEHWGARNIDSADSETEDGNDNQQKYKRS